EEVELESLASRSSRSFVSSNSFSRLPLASSCLTASSSTSYKPSTIGFLAACLSISLPSFCHLSTCCQSSNGLISNEAASRSSSLLLTEENGLMRGADASVGYSKVGVANKPDPNGVQFLLLLFVGSAMRLASMGIGWKLEDSIFFEKVRVRC